MIRVNVLYRVNRANLSRFQSVSKSVRSIRETNITVPIVPATVYKLKIPALFTVTTIGLSYGIAAIVQYETVRAEISRRINAFNRRSKSLGKLLHRYLSQYFSEGQIAVLPIIVANIGVYFIWRLPSCQQIALKLLITHPGSAHNASMLLSVFSHYSPMHLFCNMFVLWSFSDVLINLFGKYQFYATYISGGVVANFGGHLFKVLRQSNAFSLGA
ncbi:hypothetical protein GJ496_006472, partial [Pomphorhynchus laevis]